MVSGLQIVFWFDLKDMKTARGLYFIFVIQLIGAVDD
jgi:hypothetical protein